MKKLALIILCFCLACCGMTACRDTEGVNAENPSNSIDYAAVRREMSNLSCEGWYDIEGEWIYSLNSPPDGSGNAVLAKTKTDGSEYVLLAEGVAPFYVTVDGEYIYSVMIGATGTKLCRCKLDGSELQELNDDDVLCLQVTEDYLYYTKRDIETGVSLALYRSAKDGTGEELVLDKEVYYSYVVGDGLYYQDDADGETIHKYNLISKKDEKITQDRSFGFILDNETGYYLKDDGNSDEDWSGTLAKIDLNTKEETVLFEGVFMSGVVVSENDVYFINTEDNRKLYCIKKDGSDVRLISEDEDCAQLAVFEEHLMYCDMADDGVSVDGIYICKLDGSDKIAINVER